MSALQLDQCSSERGAMGEGRRFKVEWSPLAARDVERLAAFIWEETPLRAEEVVDRILDRGESLSSAPSRGRRIPELRGIADSSWREVLELPWRIIYQVRQGRRRVMIHAVLDGRRDLEEVLLERILFA